MRTATRNTFIFVLSIVITSAVARADEVKLKDGRVLSGRVLAESNGQVRLLRPYGEVVFSRDQIAGIVRKRSVFDDYDDLAAAVTEKSVDGHLALARWCKTKGLRRHRRRHLEAVVAIAPDHEAARHALGFRRVEDRWLSEAEAMPALGFVKYRGKWVKADERIATLARKEEQRRRARLQRRLNRMVSRLYSPSDAAGKRARDELLRFAKKEKIPGLAPMVGKLYDHSVVYREQLRTATIDVRADTASITAIPERTLSLGTGGSVRLQLPEIRRVSVGTTAVVPVR